MAGDQFFDSVEDIVGARDEQLEREERRRREHRAKAEAAAEEVPAAGQEFAAKAAALGIPLGADGTWYLSDDSRNSKLAVAPDGSARPVILRGITLDADGIEQDVAEDKYGNVDTFARSVVSTMAKVLREYWKRVL